MKQEIAERVARGESDTTILDHVGAKYGTTILAAPPFRGFNILLWLSPLAVAMIAVAMMALRWKSSKTIQRQNG